MTNERRKRKRGPAPATAFAAALGELRIEWILAYSPQAKGRVERLFETLQDRLLKELRVARVSSLEHANRFLEERFLPFWQERFTVEPRQQHDAHRPLGKLQLDSVLCLRESRLATSDYTLSLHRQRWAISASQVVPGHRNSRVLVEQRLDGSLWVRFRGRHLSLHIHGICFMLNGSMCCGVSASALMVRVGREAYQRMLAQPQVRPLEFAGRRPTGFV